MRKTAFIIILSMFMSMTMGSFAWADTQVGGASSEETLSKEAPTEQASDEKVSPEQTATEQASDEKVSPQQTAPEQATSDEPLSEKAAAGEASDEKTSSGEVLSEGQIRLDIDGVYTEFTYETGIPFVDGNQRTMVPFRAAMEAFGCQVSWDEQRQTAIAEKDGITVAVPVGENYIKKNGFEIFTDSQALLQNSRIYLPIRAVMEAFGAEVRWNQATETVIVVSPDSDIDQLTVHFIDVGHGDAIFIDYREYEILIDAGVTSNGAMISEYIKPYVDDELDLLIATHAHFDHVGGLPQIFEDYRISRVIDSESQADSSQWRAYEKALRNEPNCLITYDEDEVIQIAEGIELRIIEALDGQVNENNNSVAALLTANNVTVLFTGDNQAEAESVILQKVGKTDVFKGAHHGSYNANSSELLEVIKPEYIVISAGKGVNYTHPHPSALKRMFRENATVFGTFKSGTIVMTTNGNSYSFHTAAADRQLTPLMLSDAGSYQNNIN